LVCENPYRHTPGPAYIPNLTRSAAPAHALPIGKSRLSGKGDHVVAVEISRKEAEVIFLAAEGVSDGRQA